MVAIPAIFIIQWIKRVASARQQEMAHEELLATHREEAVAGMKRNISDLEMGGESEINLSPMIDCIFILLIFFIVTTVFVQEAGIDVDKPEASNSTSLPKNSILIG